jgi:hypothetical protein
MTTHAATKSAALQAHPSTLNTIAAAGTIMMHDGTSRAGRRLFLFIVEPLSRMPVKSS